LNASGAGQRILGHSLPEGTEKRGKPSDYLYNRHAVLVEFPVVSILMNVASVMEKLDIAAFAGTLAAGYSRGCLEECSHYESYC
jgi:hypothetical protein